MLEASFGLIFFLKTPKKPTSIRSVYLKVTVDGIPKETSIKRKWDVSRWDQKAKRATGTKEDAKTLNFYLDSLQVKINVYRTSLINSEKRVTSLKIIDFINGKVAPTNKILEEFQLHNDEMFALVPKEFAIGTHERYVTARSHVQEFIKFKYCMEDLEFRELNHQFILDYEFYLKTVRECSHNTTLKYISNFKKIVLRAIDKDLLHDNPFKRFKSKLTKTKKKPLTSAELHILEKHKFSTERLSMVRDIFVFQCYTGLAYIDAFQLKKSDIKIGIDGERWIMSTRQKTGSCTDIPLLPSAISILEKYENHPTCLAKNSVLPVKSNQKMNEYLKEISVLCEFDCTLNTHKARRTFGSTVTLNNDVPINVVKEMLGHSSVKQTEEYAITEQQSINRNMHVLKQKLSIQSPTPAIDSIAIIDRLERELKELKEKVASGLSINM